ncbi:hypothetical protein MMC06_002621 [Schaereria dolodes]|nr:hypothetical protein [Schaereria dolodes]
MVLNAPPESEWLSSTKVNETDVGSEPGSLMDNLPPTHPVPTMQGAFEESIMETMTETEDLESGNSKIDSVGRRKMLLEQEKYERTVAGRWKQKTGERFHPLWKLIAQISFGMHLLHQGLAKSDDEVIKILQSHVDEVDGFLERTTEDFDLAQGDINERIRYLKLPLEHGQVFDTMLNDRSFRIAIVEGNEKIEHIVDRTAVAMKDALTDTQKGLDATRELAKYLKRLEKSWQERSEEHGSVYLAMLGNTEGWTRAFLTLQQKGTKLQLSLVQLGGIIAEMQRRAGIASRKNLASVSLRSPDSRYLDESRKAATSPRLLVTPPKSPYKPLPRAPGTVTEAIQVTLPHKQSKQDIMQSPKRQPSKEAVIVRSISSARLVKAPPKQVRSASSSHPAPEPKQLGRKPSLSERTRSLTSKISFNRDHEFPVTQNNLSIQNYQIEKSNSERNGLSSTGSEPANIEMSPSRVADASHSKTLSGQMDSQSKGNRKPFLSVPVSFSPLQYPSSPVSRPISEYSSSGRTAILVAKYEGSEAGVDTSQSVFGAARFGKAVVTSAKPILRDLPLRHYHSQELLPTNIRTATRPPNSANKRSVSLCASPTTFIPPARRSSVYSQPSQPGNTTGVSPTGQSSIYSPITQSAGHSSTFSPPGQLSSELSKYSPITTTLSPPPIQSSATPSPLLVKSGPKSASAPSTTFLDLSLFPQPPQSPTPSRTSPLKAISPLTTSSPASSSDAISPPPSSIRRHPHPAPISTSTSGTIIPQCAKSPPPPTSPLQHSNFSPITSDGPKSPHEPQSSTLIEFLASAPAPFSPVAPRSAGARSTTVASSILYQRPPHHQHHRSMEERLQIEKPTTPGKAGGGWKKVFGGGGSGNGHRKSKSSVKVLDVKGEERRGMSVGVVDFEKVGEKGRKRKKRREGNGEGGFTGVGKDGVWISRKNFVKT